MNKTGTEGGDSKVTLREIEEKMMEGGAGWKKDIIHGPGGTVDYDEDKILRVLISEDRFSVSDEGGSQAKVFSTRIFLENGCTIRYRRFGAEEEKPSESLKTIVRPPGTTWRRAGELLFSRKKFEQCIEPAVADWHEEYLAAVDQKCGRIKMAAIRVRHTWALMKAFGMLKWFDLIGRVVRKLAGTGE